MVKKRFSTEAKGFEKVDALLNAGDVVDGVPLMGVTEVTEKVMTVIST
jgi:hypothetical protein